MPSARGNSRGRGCDRFEFWDFWDCLWRIGGELELHFCIFLLMLLFVLALFKSLLVSVSFLNFSFEFFDLHSWVKSRMSSLPPDFEPKIVCAKSPNRFTRQSRAKQTLVAKGFPGSYPNGWIMLNLAACGHVQIVCHVSNLPLVSVLRNSCFGHWNYLKATFFSILFQPLFCWGVSQFARPKNLVAKVAGSWRYQSCLCFSRNHIRGQCACFWLCVWTVFFQLFYNIHSVYINIIKHINILIYTLNIHVHLYTYVFEE